MGKLRFYNENFIKFLKCVNIRINNFKCKEYVNRSHLLFSDTFWGLKQLRLFARCTRVTRALATWREQTSALIYGRHCGRVLQC